MRTLQCKNKLKNQIFAHENMKKQPSKDAHNSQRIFFSVLAWLRKRPILGRNRNLIGSPCLLSTISLIETHIDRWKKEIRDVETFLFRHIVDFL